MKRLLAILKERARNAGTFARVFAEWFYVSVMIGLIGGLIGSAFYVSILKANNIREANPNLIFLLPVGGLIIVALYKITKTEGEGTNRIIDSILVGDDVPLALTPVIFISTVITHLLGGSAGREGAALQIGGSIGCSVGMILNLDEKEQRIAILAGMSAVFSALFGTPITAIVFALEVCSVGIIHYSGLVPCGVSALMAYGVTRFFNIAPTRFVYAPVAHSIPLLLKVIALAVLCAVLSILFCRTMHFSSRTASRIFRSSYVRILFGSALLIAMTLLVGNQDYNGSGVSIIKGAIENGAAKPEAFLLKMLFTAVTLSCGFKGGEIVPTFFIGATFGCIFGPLLGMPAGFAAAIGLAATFCGAVNCPLATVILSVELFGSGEVLYFAIACFVSYMLSGYSSLYEEQKIVYSKLKAEFINKKAE